MRLYIMLFSLLLSFAAHGVESQRYFGQLAYNHVSPHVSIRGIHELTVEAAAKTPHYVFRYNDAGQLVELIRKHPESWKQHPLAHVGKVYRIAFSYSAGREERLFFDESGKPMRNIRGVFKEVYEYSPDGFKTALRFFDENGQPMNSGWNIARYAWERKAGFVVERRFDLQGNARPISPYFSFYTVGIKYGQNGVPTGTYNLDDSLAVINNASGIASYQDMYDEDGDHMRWSYHDAGNAPVLSGFYTAALKTYDGAGNVIRVEYLGLDGKNVREEKFAGAS